MDFLNVTNSSLHSGYICTSGLKSFQISAELGPGTVNARKPESDGCL